ncbi:MAG TPA: threonylcarbamoyl-AMP synthase [Firmicutes bacterium]|nr:threonylcarbamoyl-AMP synthase [Bacillota bacterium]
METKIIDWDEMALAVKAIKNGEAICFPTETVYGIGAISNSASSFEKLVSLKRRPSDKPFTVMCSSLTQVAMLAEVDVNSIAVMQTFMPGEITILLKARKNLPSYLTLGGEKIGVRIPNSKEVIEFIDKIGCPLLVPSANKSGEKPALSSKEAFDIFNKEVPYIINGVCSSLKASTVVDLTCDAIKLVREGPIDFSKIKSVFDSASYSISIGSDHGGFELKEKIIHHLEERGFQVIDEGTYSKESCDYPLFAKKVGEDVVTKRANSGIVCCTSGEGVCIACNKIKGIRCGIGYDDIVTGKCKEHNNCNVISFGQAYMSASDVLKRVDIFLTEKFSSLEKHHRRVEEIE